MSIFADLTKDERFALGRALVLRRVPTIRWVPPKFVLALVTEDMKVIDTSPIAEEIASPFTRMFYRGQGGHHPGLVTHWLGAEWNYFLHELIVEGVVLRRRIEVRRPRRDSPAGGYSRRKPSTSPLSWTAEQWRDVYQPDRTSEIEEIRASDLVTIYDDYMPERSKVALAQLPISALTLLQLLAQASESEGE